MRKFLGILVLTLLLAAVFTGCTGEATTDNGDTETGLVDGVWVGNATMNPENTRYSFGTVELTVENGEIVAVDYQEIQGPFAEAKGADYRYEAFLPAVENLSQQLLDTQDVSQIDTVAEATSTTGYFVDAVTNALESAEAGEQLYVNGTFVGKTESDSRGVFAIGYITFSDGAITHILFEERNSEGEPKGEDYPHEAYHEAIKALPAQLMETGNLDEVDTVAEATSTSDKFKEVFSPYFN